MIQPFVDAFMEAKPALLESFTEVLPGSPFELLRRTLAAISKRFDVEQITTLDHGDYQGTLVFVIPEDTYQPNTYWVVKWVYGSCSGCDTFEAVLDETAEADRPKEMLVMALHMLQSLQEI